MNLDKVRDFVALHQEEEELKKALDAVKSSKAHLGEIIIDEMTAEGIRNVPIDIDGEGFTVYPSKTLRASVKRPSEEEIANGIDSEAIMGSLATRLQLLGYGDSVKLTINANTLSSLVREMLAGTDDEKPQLDPGLRGLIKTYTDHKLKVLSTPKTESASERAAANMKEAEA